MIKTSNLTLNRNKFCTPREGNPGNVLLTSRNRIEYLYQCRGIQQCMGRPEDVDLTGGLSITYKGQDFLKGCVHCCAFVLAINSQHNSHKKET